MREAIGALLWVNGWLVGWVIVNVAKPEYVDSVAEGMRWAFIILVFWPAVVVARLVGAV